MKHVDELRDPAAVSALVATLRAELRQPWSLMEVCGGQTHALVRFGLDSLLPPELTLIHGPGCPVCVTPVAVIDHALQIAARPDLIFCSFGDMLRVPGSAADLRAVRARGGDVRVLTSPLDALALARQHPERPVVFFAVGFETTAPVVAMAVQQAAAEGLHNFSVLVSHVLVPPALHALLSEPEHRIHGLLAAGHVCAIMGSEAYHPIAAHYGVPIAITGFEPVDLLLGVLAVVRQLQSGRAEVENTYRRVARDEGNPTARALLERVFEPCDQAWRGLGLLPRSGLRLRSTFESFDAARRFPFVGTPGVEDPACQAGLVLQGRLRPTDCPEFGRRCTPDTPLGATMVSSEGACAAYWRYKRDN